ncbi:hypothetical protein [Sphingorhabdus sp. Alg239-R122]|uniref:hypothetical protein n=1 Tax=Sphingorhabdus sp. Alg239-R122 TaxID=2305989 RepID=UPI0013DCB37A|nr:hypothetical protein [Sphingorhabdus sp. Alg239-R122]
MDITVKTPWHLWVVGIVSLLWNSIGAYDYFMTQTNNAEYLKDFTEVQLNHFAAYPAWVQGAWALGVWGALLGSILLLARSRFAVPVFAISLLGLALSTLYNFILADVKLTEIAGPEALYFTIFIWVVAIALWLYARAQRANGVLR